MEPSGNPSPAETPSVPKATDGVTPDHPAEPLASAEPAEDSSPPRSEPPVAPTAIPPKAATWEEKEPGEWLPEALLPHLETLKEYRYEDPLQREAAAGSGWKILAATRRGRLHAHRGQHREDALGFASGSNFIALCVSDGAGAYPFSRIGSEITCRTVVASLEKTFTESAGDLSNLDREALTTRVAEAMLAAAKAAITELNQIAEKAAFLPKDFRCTLLCAVLYMGTRADVALTSQVGDGFFAGLSRDGQARRYGSSDSGSYSGQVTCFVPDADALNHAARIRSIELADLEALILCSDGIEDPYYPLEKNAAAIFRQLCDGEANSLPGFEAAKLPGPVIGDVSARERLAQWLAFEKKGENDDRTILIVHRDPVARGWREISSVATPQS